MPSDNCGSSWTSHRNSAVDSRRLAAVWGLRFLLCSTEIQPLVSHVVGLPCPRFGLF